MEAGDIMYPTQKMRVDIQQQIAKLTKDCSDKGICPNMPPFDPGIAARGNAGFDEFDQLRLQALLNALEAGSKVNTIQISPIEAVSQVSSPASLTRSLSKKDGISTSSSSLASPENLSRTLSPVSMNQPIIDIESFKKLNVISAAESLPTNNPVEGLVILIIDDEPGKQKRLKMLMEYFAFEKQIKYRIYSVFSGQAAVDLFINGFQCDMVCLDYYIGTGTAFDQGPEVARKIRSHYFDLDSKAIQAIKEVLSHKQDGTLLPGSPQILSIIQDYLVSCNTSRSVEVETVDTKLQDDVVSPFNKRNGIVPEPKIMGYSDTFVQLKSLYQKKQQEQKNQNNTSAEAREQSLNSKAQAETHTLATQAKARSIVFEATSSTNNSRANKTDNVDQTADLALLDECFMMPINQRDLSDKLTRYLGR